MDLDLWSEINQESFYAALIKFAVIVFFENAFKSSRFRPSYNGYSDLKAAAEPVAKT